MAKDIEGENIVIGDEVYYARRHPYYAKGLLIKTKVTNITKEGDVKMGKYISTKYEKQILVFKKRWL